MSDTDSLPRIFQANVWRLFQLVLRPTLSALPVHAELRLGEAGSLGDFLEMTASQVDNYTANEVAKAFTLVLAGLFERQLRIWTRSRRSGVLANGSFRRLLADSAGEAKVDLQHGRLGHALIEMFLVANVFRHGDRPSMSSLRSHSPELWEYERSRYVDLLPPNPDASEKLLLQLTDVVRYAGACTRFWGCADTLPDAVRDPHFG